MDDTGKHLSDLEGKVSKVEDDTQGLGGRVRKVEDDILVIQTEFKHLATKAWVLGGVVGGMVLAASLSLAVVKIFS